MLSTLDLVVVVVYLLGVAAFGIRAGGRQQTTEDYFLGGRNLPWWAVCFSVVATETSTLTVIGVPPHPRELAPGCEGRLEPAALGRALEHQLEGGEAILVALR